MEQRRVGGTSELRFRTETVEVYLDQEKFEKTVTLRPRQRVTVDPDEARKL